MHTLYNLETQIPTLFHITPAKVHDTKAMDEIPYEAVPTMTSGGYSPLTAWVHTSWSGARRSSYSSRMR